MSTQSRIDLGTITNPIVSQHLHQILFPVIDDVLSEAIELSPNNQTSRDYTKACHDLKASFAKVEKYSPNFAAEFVRGCLPEQGQRNPSHNEDSNGNGSNGNGNNKNGSKDGGGDSSSSNNNSSSGNSNDKTDKSESINNSDNTNNNNPDNSQMSSSLYNSRYDEAEACIRHSGLPCHEYSLQNTKTEFRTLNDRSMSLKRILSQVPDDIKLPKKDFLECIRSIAQTIQSFLLAIDDVMRYYSKDREIKRALDMHKKKLVNDSKMFSERIKIYLRDYKKKSPVFKVVDMLIEDINVVIVAVSICQHQENSSR